MKKTLVLLLIGIIVYSNPIRASIKLNPIPQNVIMSGDSLVFSGLFKTYGMDDLKPNVLKILIEKTNGRIHEEGIPFRIGTKDSKSVKKYRNKIPDCKEGYYLSVRDNEIIVAGSDDRGLYYGLQTMGQLIIRNLSTKDSLFSLPKVEITDWPDVAVRGVVEGFYGQPWSHEARMGLIDFYSEHKLNTYIYGPKNDKYHSSPKWRQPYPQNEAEQLKELISYANDKEVDFVWAIHPGFDIKWNDDDRDKLIKKFESMYNLGVRAFAVFFDDISGKGTDAEMQVKLLNYINQNFIKSKKDLKPLIMCPTEYNRSRRKEETRYLEILGEKLDDDVHIMWTGDRALSDITSENIQWIQTLIKRKPYIWWNFPVTDYSNSRILMGEVYGIDKSIKTEVSGFVSNPMEYAEASKLALFSVADYTWNIEAYNSEKSWKEGIKSLLPDAYEAFECFCTHSSATGEVHYPRMESENIRKFAEKIMKQIQTESSYNDIDMEELKEEFERMKMSADKLYLAKSNMPLIQEIEPWIYAFDLWSQMGLEAIEMAEDIKNGNSDSARRRLEHIKILQARLSKNKRRASVGTAVIQPFVKGIMNFVETK